MINHPVAERRCSGATMPRRTRHPSRVIVHRGSASSSNSVATAEMPPLPRLSASAEGPESWTSRRPAFDTARLPGPWRSSRLDGPPPGLLGPRAPCHPDVRASSLRDVATARPLDTLRSGSSGIRIFSHRDTSGLGRPATGIVRRRDAQMSRPPDGGPFRPLDRPTAERPALVMPWPLALPRAGSSGPWTVGDRDVLAPRPPGPVTSGPRDVLTAGGPGPRPS